MMLSGEGEGEEGVQRPLSQCRDSVSKGLLSFLPSSHCLRSPCVVRASTPLPPFGAFATRELAFPSDPPLVSSVPFRVSSQVSHQTNPSDGMSRMTDAHAKKGGGGGDATRVTGSNFRHDLADYNRASSLSNRRFHEENGAPCPSLTTAARASKRVSRELRLSCGEPIRRSSLRQTRSLLRPLSHSPST